MIDTNTLAREIVAALVYLNSHKEAVPSHGHGLFSAIREKYAKRAQSVEGGSLDDAAVEAIKEKLDAALAPEPLPEHVVVPPEPQLSPTPVLGDFAAEPVPTEPLPVETETSASAS